MRRVASELSSTIAILLTRGSNSSRAVINPSSRRGMPSLCSRAMSRAKCSPTICFSTGNVWPEQLMTTISSRLMTPCRIRLNKPAKATAVAGSTDNPSILATTCKARKASASVTASIVPPYSLISSRNTVYASPGTPVARVVISVTG